MPQREGVATQDINPAATAASIALPPSARTCSPTFAPAFSPATPPISRRRNLLREETQPGIARLASTAACPLRFSISRREINLLMIEKGLAAIEKEFNDS